MSTFIFNPENLPSGAHNFPKPNLIRGKAKHENVIKLEKQKNNTNSIFCILCVKDIFQHQFNSHLKKHRKFVKDSELISSNTPVKDPVFQQINQKSIMRKQNQGKIIKRSSVASQSQSDKSKFIKSQKSQQKSLIEKLRIQPENELHLSQHISSQRSLVIHDSQQSESFYNQIQIQTIAQLRKQTSYQINRGSQQQRKPIRNPSKEKIQEISNNSSIRGHRRAQSSISDLSHKSACSYEIKQELYLNKSNLWGDNSVFSTDFGKKIDKALQMNVPSGLND